MVIVGIFGMMEKSQSRMTIGCETL